jgi:predicted O-methyltransferase YrrM
MKILYRIKSFLKFRIKAKPLIGHGIHSPFVYNLASQILLPAKKKKSLLPLVEKIRKELKPNNKQLIINDLGTGKKKTPYKRSISSIAKTSISNASKCRLLYTLAKETNPATIIELGTSLGISTISLALGAPNSTVYTIEGSEELAAIAKENFHKAGLSNINSIVGSFDDLLPELLLKLNTPLVAYIDGNHSFDATLRYFEMILPYVDGNSLLIFDDIHWSEGMEKAWNTICQHSKVVLSIDLFQVGLVCFRNGVPKQHFMVKY